ncbi:MAG: type VI secretion system lipoprotein TssJ [Variovorax sp.]
MRIPGFCRSSYRNPSGALLRRRAVQALALVLPLAFVGCATKPVVTPLSLTAKAGADSNPDSRGRASPLKVRVYALKSPGAFQGADYFSLNDSETATLGAELVQREEMLLQPGETKKLELILPADVKVIGVVAAYRDLERARWREVRPVQPGKPVQMAITFGARQMQIEQK